MADLSKKLQVFNGFKNAGGTLLHPDNKLRCLFGTGVSAIAIQVKDANFVADCPLITPTINKILECSSPIEITDITAPDKGGLAAYPGAVSFLPAPWILNAVVEASSSNSVFLISKAIKAA